MCPKCKKSYMVEINNDSPTNVLGNICVCNNDLKCGWLCDNCQELWYAFDNDCDCGNTSKGTQVLFVETQIKTNRSLIANFWYSLKGLF